MNDLEVCLIQRAHASYGAIWGTPHIPPVTGLCQGPSVVLCFEDQDEVPQSLKFHHKNPFTSLAVLDKMLKRGCGSCGIMRENHPFDVLFKPKTEFMRLPTGTSNTERNCWSAGRTAILSLFLINVEKYTKTVVKQYNKDQHAFD